MIWRLVAAAALTVTAAGCGSCPAPDPIQHTTVVRIHDCLPMPEYDQKFKNELVNDLSQVKPGSALGRFVIDSRDLRERNREACSNS